ncbi:MAG TPA: 2-amino-4-hydroxy-6-hydroxymethyldihydropteridine diphosphokinase [Gemmatimonadota bacterium]|nr:2-amino-4-hydroxy-6-hydroxymethyldihydropteridine diphosphokinase [Gemmatimonadota bacterium]
MTWCDWKIATGGHERVEDQERLDEPVVNTVLLGLGSNEGDRVRQLERALERLKRLIRIERVSSIYETQPVGVRDQPWFLNLVCLGHTRLLPYDLLEFLHEVENSLGRVRSEERFGPRTIDIDILAYEERVLERHDLVLPHPRMTERRFVLEPLAEIVPEWRHPVEGKTAAELLEGLDGDIVRFFSNPPPGSGPAPIL